MKILCISCLEAKVSSGMSWSVPARIKAQSKYDDVMWWNLNNEVMPHWKKTGVFNNIGSFSSIEDLPDGFSIPDIVIFEGVYYFKYINLSKKLRARNIPYIIVPRSMLTYSAIHNNKFIKKTIANKLFFNSFIKHAIAIQYLTNKEYKDSGPFWNENKIIAPNGIYLPDKVHGKVCEKAINATFIGRLDIYQKGLDLLIQACSSISDKLVSEGLFITLYGPDEKGSQKVVESMINEKHLEKVIKLGGEVKGERKEQVLLASDLFIMTSRFEGMSMGLIEALSYSIPAMITPGTNFCDEINDYDAGWICEGNTNAIANCLLTIVQKKDALLDKGHNARELSKKYQWDDIAKQFHNEVLTLLNNK